MSRSSQKIKFEYPVTTEERAALVTGAALGCVVTIVVALFVLL